VLTGDFDEKLHQTNTTLLANMRWYTDNIGIPCFLKAACTNTLLRPVACYIELCVLNEQLLAPKHKLTYVRLVGSR